MNIFISYRRADSAATTHRVYEALTDRHGPENVFKDVDSIPAGVDFRQYMAESLAVCRVLTAIIGTDWLNARDEEGRRLDREDDYVRIEIETALGLRIPVIPVLVGDATMPAGDALPPTLAPLAYQNAIRVRPGPEFVNDVAKLVDAIEPFRSGGLATERHLAQPNWWQRTLAPVRRKLFPGRAPRGQGHLCPYCGEPLVLGEDPSDPTMLRCTTGTSVGCSFQILRRLGNLPWLNFSVFGYGEAGEDLWLLQVWGKLLRRIRTPSAVFALARTGTENRQLARYRSIRSTDRGSPVHWYPVTSEAVFLEVVARRRWMQSSFLMGLLNYPEGEFSMDGMDRLARVHALSSQGMMFFLDAGPIISEGGASFDLLMRFNRLLEDYRFTAKGRFRPFAICVAWEEVKEGASPPAEFLRAYHALKSMPVTLRGIEQGHHLCLEYAPTLMELIEQWYGDDIGSVPTRNPVMIFPIMLPNTGAGAGRTATRKEALDRLLDPVLWLLHVHKRIRLPKA